MKKVKSMTPIEEAKTRLPRMQESYRLVEALRDHWADIMLHALKQEGHVYLDENEYCKLKSELMQIFIGNIKI